MAMVASTTWQTGTWDRLRDRSRQVRDLEHELEVMRAELAARVAPELLDEHALVGNADYLVRRACEELDRARRRDGYAFSLVLVTIVDAQPDDSWRVAATLRDAIRVYDGCCRISHEELVVLLAGARAGFRCSTERRLLPSVVQALGDAPLRARIGGATSGVDGADLDSLLARARARTRARRR